MVPPGQYLLQAQRSMFNGWTVIGAAGNVGPISGMFSQNGFEAPAQSGQQWLDLTGNSNSATGVEQTVKTVADAIYELSFHVGNIVDQSGLFGTSSTVDVLVNGESIGTRTNKGGLGTMKLNWQRFEMSFTARSASTKLSFINRDGSSDNANGLDNVILTAREPQP